ncbi:MAG: toll/interleukin-1 receptor domain-containing protein [bacterium]|nr:toll/interleukin-1 receptor domain-containing protein [bacterium]
MKSYIGNYGLVKITGGKFKGRFGYYDDEDTDFDGIEKSVIYFGEMFDNSKYYYIEHKYITDDFNTEDLKRRQSEITLKLWKGVSDSERLKLIEEKNLIDYEIYNRFEHYLESNQLKNKKVFLSHSSVDKSIVISVALDLQEKGISTWLDAFDILPGESITSKINKGLEECEFVLLFLSNNSVKSNWVTKEWETMLWDEINSGKIKIIPVKLEECEIPKILQTKKYIDLSKNYSDGLFQIIQTIKTYEKND